MKETIKNFTSENLKDIRVSIQDALKPVEEQYGVTFNLGKITYEEFSFRSSVECSVGNGMDAAREKFEADIRRGYGRMFKLSIEDFGQKMFHAGKEYTIVGLNTRARTKPLQMVDAEGKTYSVTVELYKKHKINADGSIGVTE